MQGNLAVTRRMVAYATKHDLTIPHLSFVNPYWGKGKRTLAWRVSGHAFGAKKASAQKTQALRRLLFPNALRIIPVTYRWAGHLYRRSGKPHGTVWHNSGSTFASPQQIHAWHLANGWTGIGYHFVVRKNGDVYRGRPEWALGAHTFGASEWLGVCFEGNFMRERMSEKQIQAGRALHRYLRAKYGGRPDRRHKDMPRNSTDCPGRYFPFNKIT